MRYFGGPESATFCTETVPRDQVEPVNSGGGFDPDDSDPVYLAAVSIWSRLVPKDICGQKRMHASSTSDTALKS